MFLRTKRIKGHDYLLLVETYRDGRRVRQRTLYYFGRRDCIDVDYVRRILAAMPGHAFLLKPAVGRQSP